MRKLAGTIAVLLVFVEAGICPAQTRPVGRYAAQLAAECDDLLRFAVRRPYGWGWERAASPSWENKSIPRLVSMEPRGTPAAALILLRAGELLHADAYKQAALQAARGVVACQKANGLIPGQVTFGASPGGHDPMAAVPDRSATQACLALLLTVIDGESERDPRLVHAATQAVRWLAKQQTPLGGWPSAYPPGADPDDAQRLIRLDSDEYRNGAVALLLAGEVLDDAMARRDAAKTLAVLAKLRLNEVGVAGRGLWTTVYNLDGSPARKLGEFPYAVDVVACRYAMQALLIGYLLNEDRAAGLALNQSAGMLTALASEDGRWSRLYSLATALPLHVEPRVVEPAPEPELSPASQPTSRPAIGMGIRPMVLRPPAPRPKPRPQGVEQSALGSSERPTDVLDAVGNLKTLGVGKYRQMLAVHFPLKYRMALILCGLSDGTITVDLPTQSAEIPAFLQQQEELFPTPTRFPPQELSQRLQRLWMLLIRAELESKSLPQ